MGMCALSSDLQAEILQGPRVPKQRLEAAATAASAAFHQCPNLDILVPAMVDGGIDELEKRCALTPGPQLLACLTPLKMTLRDIGRSTGNEGHTASLTHKHTHGPLAVICLLHQTAGTPIQMLLDTAGLMDVSGGGVSKIRGCAC